MSEQHKVINCTNASEDDSACESVDKDALAQFKIIIIVVFIALLLFLGFFVYNLIKCYLPKWRGRGEFQQVPKQSEVESTNKKGVQIEFETAS